MSDQPIQNVILLHLRLALPRKCEKQGPIRHFVRHEKVRNALSIYLLTDNYILSTPYRPPIVEVSTLVLVGVAVAWLVTQLFTMQAAKWVIQRAQDESRTQRDEVVEHFNERLEGVEGHFNVQLEAFEGRFSEAYKTDMETISAEMNKIPERIKFTAMSEKGAEVRALQAYIEKEGSDVDQKVDLMEAGYLQANPESMTHMALVKAAEADVSPKYRKENPFKASMFDVGKAIVLPRLEEAFLGTSNFKRSRKGNVTNPYGL